MHIERTSTNEATSFGRLLLVVIVFEVAMLGSGRILQLGPLTVRMWLFLGAFAYTGWSSFFRRGLSPAAVILCSWLAVTLCFSSVVGVIQHADLSLVIEDVKPLLYFFTLLFFEAVIRSEREVSIVVSVLEISAALTCLAYALIIGLLLTKAISLAKLVTILGSMAETDVAFRGDSGMFLYKGALYVCVAFIFFVFAKGKRARVAAVVSFLGVIATGTRGFIVALLGTALVYIMISRGKRTRKLLAVIAFTVLGVAAWSVIARPEAETSASDLERIVTTQQVLNRLNAVTFLFGHGFGVGVPERPIHMESSFVEVFHKQGLLGLAWWAAVFAIFIERFRRALHSAPNEVVYPLFLSSCFVFFESLTNPWITNPIGMAVLLIGLASLRVFSELPAPSVINSGLVAPQHL